ncbi:MAG: polyprenyl diphosphate synthase [Pseudomonadota bacterium]
MELFDMHVAIIMDGNGRWATTRGMQRLIGHARGAERVRSIVEAAVDNGLGHLTLFAFSTENWKRSEAEVKGLMALFKRFIRAEKANLFTKGVKVRFIGSRDGLDTALLDLMDGLVAQTQDCARLVLTIAINYGGRDEITRAIGRIAKKVETGALSSDDITEKLVTDHLDTRDLPEPDLVIRTSGEYRVSNFLPWQSVYSEYLFEQTTWPDFTPELFASILTEYKNRDRRYGAVLQK